MVIVAVEAGIDVSSLELVTSIGGAKPFKLANDEASALQIAQVLPEGCPVHLESSGGYERTVQRVLTRAGFDVRVHNPLKARRLAQAIGASAKTDPLDAMDLSCTGALLPVHEPKSEERRGLADFSRAIDVLKRSIASYKVRRAVPELDEDARCAYDSAIQALEQQVKALEQKFVKRIKASAYRLEYELAQSVKCIGALTARVCICELPENFRKRSIAQICSYAGLAPIDNSSGKRDGTRRIGRGNSRLKRSFYMAGLTAIAREAWAKNLYARLRAKGRAHQQAIVAVMRRLLVRLLTVLKRGSPWQAEPQRT